MRHLFSENSLKTIWRDFLNDKSLKIWKVLMRFLDLPPWTNRSKGLEFTSILLTSFFFVRKPRQQMSGLLLNETSFFLKLSDFFEYMSWLLYGFLEFQQHFLTTIWQNFIFWSFQDLTIGGAISSPIVYRGRRFHWFFGTTWLARPSLYNIDTFSLTSFGLYGENRSLWPLITILNQCQVL